MVKGKNSHATRNPWFFVKIIASQLASSQLDVSRETVVSVGFKVSVRGNQHFSQCHIKSTISAASSTKNFVWVYGIMMLVFYWVLYQSVHWLRTSQGIKVVEWSRSCP